LRRHSTNPFVLSRSIGPAPVVLLARNRLYALVRSGLEVACDTILEAMLNVRAGSSIL
jgi:hypothetical protein